VTVVTEGQGRQGHRHVSRVPRVGTTVQAFDLAVRLGIRVVEVPDLPRVVIYLQRYDLALVKADLDPQTRAVAADWLLSEAVRPPRLPELR